MSPLHSALAAKQISSHRRPAPHARQPVSLWNCLILSADPSRRDGIAKAAAAAGWETLACDSTGAAKRHVARWRLGLTIVDLQRLDADQRTAYQEFVDGVAVRRETLLLLCDDSESPLGESWARQLGVWMYLPEAVLDEPLTEICQKARSSAEKIQATTHPGSPVVPSPASATSSLGEAN
ncbi:hypothetical protein Mal64_20390 [Pseudobythopirellula maris]|uniref:Response regulatory domain-containing protein n=1 Tax=Pseudobythopirellula maris TaxID=2527991 RepID=A0A5C5ZNA9_9BACT|nr:hypothetical protein [Pseudobythopirellula maris]TWT88555.1 hypothetical protein Mal64_20390 [Pseudobythopirellula maris]